MTKVVLPVGWTHAVLGDVSDGFEAGRNLSAQGRPATAAEYGVLKISAVTWGTFDAGENKALFDVDIPQAHEIVRRGDLLISRANTTELVGAVVRVAADHERLMLPDKILRILYRRHAVDPEFLKYALRRSSVRKYFASV